MMIKPALLTVDCFMALSSGITSGYIVTRAKTKALIGGGGVYSYIHVLLDEFLLKSVVITVDFKRNSSGRTRIYEYAPPPPTDALVSALIVTPSSSFQTNVGIFL